MSVASAGSSPNTMFERVAKLNWGIITLLCALAFVGVLMHFSVSSGAWTDMPLTHGTRFVVLLVVLMLSAMFLDTRFWLAIAYPFYGFALLLLVAVEAVGATRMGAQRWLDIGPMSLQPSEFMKIAIVLALARYYHQLDPRRTGTVLWVIPPFLMIAAPVALVMHQPDLGTAMLIMFAGLMVMFLGGLLWRIIALGVGLAVGGAPVCVPERAAWLSARSDQRLSRFGRRSARRWLPCAAIENRDWISGLVWARLFAGGRNHSSTFCRKNTLILSTR